MDKVDTELNDIRYEIELAKVKIELQTKLNELDLAKSGIHYFINGFFMIASNPVLLILTVISFFIGMWIGHRI